MTEKIFPGIMPGGPGGPDEPTCVCGCLCTPQDPTDNDFEDDRSEES